jgi:hypothetical protein
VAQWAFTGFRLTYDLQGETFITEQLGEKEVTNGRSPILLFAIPSALA